MEIPMVVLFAEIVLVLVLGIGWIYGARRLHLKRHHRAVYPILVTHLITVFLWMVPRGSTWIWVPSADNFLLFTHAVLGIISIILGIVVIGAFLYTKGMPLSLLRKMKPLMFVILILWLLAFILGLFIYSDFYL